MKKLVVLLLVVLCVAHHDFWWWHTAEPLVFGFMPISLAWHAAITVAAGLVWWLSATYCWPRELEEFEES